MVIERVKCAVVKSLGVLLFQFLIIMVLGNTNVLTRTLVFGFMAGIENDSSK